MKNLKCKLISNKQISKKCLWLFFYCSAGGLVTAVAPVVIKGNGLWVGWPGLHSKEPLGDIPESDPTDQTPTAGLRSDQVSNFKKLKKCIFLKAKMQKLFGKVIS